MFVEFVVGNYRSFKERQRLSMVASTNLESQTGNQFETGFRIAPELLQSVCILGPNASGKSNLVRAMDFLRDFATDSSKDLQEGDKIDVEPFKLSSKALSEPSEFEISFIVGETLYRYGLLADKIRVHAEWLFSKSKEKGSQEREAFVRQYNPDSDSYTWRINTALLRGKREQWKAATRSNATFLSTAVQNNAADLKEPFNWLRVNFRPVLSVPALTPVYTFKILKEPEERAKILDFVKEIDLSISDIDVTEKEFDPNELSDNLPDAFRAEIIKEFSKKKFYVARPGHLDDEGNQIYFDFRDESDGTQIIIALAGPWLDVLENGYAIIVDELNNSLHPGALRYLVELFHSPEHNKNNAQLIFVTHGTSVLAQQTMQRDQVWFMERTPQQSTRLFPLTEFKPRKGEALEKGYLGGRYGALPNIKGFY